MNMGFVIKQNIIEPVIRSLSLEDKKKCIEVYAHNDTFLQYHINSVSAGCYPECDNIHDLVHYSFNRIEILVNTVLTIMRSGIIETEEQLKQYLVDNFSDKEDTEAILYCIETMIKHSDGSGMNNWSNFKSYFNV